MSAISIELTRHFLQNLGEKLIFFMYLVYYRKEKKYREYFAIYGNSTAMVYLAEQMVCLFDGAGYAKGVKCRCLKSLGEIAVCCVHG